MSVNNDLKKETNGRPWKEIGLYSSYEEASGAKSVFLEKNSRMQAKIKRRHAKDKFSLKIRLLEEFAKQETKKSGKNKRRNKKNSNRGKSDTSPAV